MPPEDVALARGSHGTPEAGRCLMEHVSVVAGARFGPLPACTHPVLAVLAVRVNDGVSDAARNRLVRRAPALARARGDRDPALTWRLVEHAARMTEGLRPGDGAAVRRRRRARRARRRWERVRAWTASPPARVRFPRWAADAAALRALGELLAAVDALRVAAGPAGSPGRDRALTALLDTAIVTTHATDTPTTDTPTTDTPTTDTPTTDTEEVYA